MKHQKLKQDLMLFAISYHVRKKTSGFVESGVFLIGPELNINAGGGLPDQSRDGEEPYKSPCG